MARKRPLFREALRSADLAIPDGTGLLWAARFLGKGLPARVTGTDMVGRICSLAAKEGRSVFLLGGRSGIAEMAADRLKTEYPDLLVAGAMSGGSVEYDETGMPILDYEVERAINLAAPDILFVAFGHGNQEEWIHANLHRLPSVRVAAGIGGAFDFIAGKAKRAPAWMRKAGLEWLWRLILQPWRVGRIVTATVVFPLYVVAERFGFLKDK
ncbi:MAG: WecB/TagA/CpsF family glycosyltransferase [Candidatus Paceibacterota bacterium]